MDADSGVFVEDAFQSCLADVAEPGKLRHGGLAVDIAVQVADGMAESNRVGGIRYGGDGASFRQGQHQLLQVGGHHLGIGGGGEEGSQGGRGGKGAELSVSAADKGKHGGDDFLLVPGEPEDFFRQEGSQRTFRREGKYQQIGALLSVYDKFMELQWLVEDNGAVREVINSLIAGDTGLAVHDIEAFPEVMGFSREGIAPVEMCLEEGVHVSDADLLPDRIGKPDRAVCFLVHCFLLLSQNYIFMS